MNPIPKSSLKVMTSTLEECIRMTRSYNFCAGPAALPEAVEVTPTLEDSYLWLLERKG